MGSDRERQRLEEGLLVLLRHDQDLAGSRHARRSECGETASSGADARIPTGADRSKGTLERRLHASVQPLDPARLEDDGALLSWVDRKSRVLEAPKHLFPLLLGGSRIAVDEDERGACGERLAETHPRLHPYRLRCGVNRTEERLLSCLRCERRRDECEPRARAQSRSQLEPGNEEARDHPNTCSIRTYVLLSR